jgi:nucleoside-diphosphate-sugar epimerase
MISEILNGNNPGYPDVGVNFSIVDVRDAAIGHIKAMFEPASAGQRIALTGHNFSLSQIFKQLKK